MAKLDQEHCLSAAVPAGLPSTPTTCSGWNAVNPDGRCKYTDCFVGDKNTTNCFGCSDNDCDNGCGPEPSSILTAFGNFIVPESAGEIFDFNDACCNHDYCYASTTYDQASCDLQLLNDALASCAGANADDIILLQSSVRFVRNLLAPIVVVRWELCERAAQLFYWAVGVFGAGPYADGQEITKSWEGSEQCAAP